MKAGPTSQCLQAERAAGRQDKLVYYAFDLLWGDGDLRDLPQLECKQALINLLGENDIELPILYSEHLTGDGQEMFEHAAKLNWEGIIFKKGDAPYLRSQLAWLKVKCVQKGNFRHRVREGSYRGRRALPGRKKARTWSTWARSAPDGPERSQAKSGSNSIRSLARSRS